MRYLFLILLFVSCNTSTTSKMCEAEKIAVHACEKEVDKLFQENGILKEEREEIQEYISILEKENAYLKKQNDSLRGNLQN